MPLEKVPTLSSPRSASPTISRTSSIALIARPRGSWQATVQHQHLRGCQPALEPEELGEVADPPPRLPITCRSAEHHRLAAGGPNETEQELDGRGLACPVRTEEPEDLTAADRHRQAAQRRRAAILLAKLDREHGRRERGSPRDVSATQSLASDASSLLAQPIC